MGRRLYIAVLLLSPVSYLLAQEEPPPGGYPPGIELPADASVELVETACTKCHDLAGLQAYKGYWGQRQWRSMVQTMVDNGAELDEMQAAAVVDYLTKYFGPGTRE